LDIPVYIGAVPKPGLIGRTVTRRASGEKSRERGHCLSVHLQCVVSVILSSGMPASGVEDKIGTGWVSSIPW